MKELNRIYSRGIKLIEPEELTTTLRGRSAIAKQLTSMFDSARNEINVVTTSKGLDDLANYLESLTKAKQRGVKVRVISVETKVPSEVVKILGDIADVKVSKKKEVACGEFCIVDNREFIFSLSDSNVEPSQALAMWSKSRYASETTFLPIFQTLWENSQKLRAV
jgi:sugar-specific transcriptional regulator TrmB